MSLVERSERELRAAGFFDKDGAYDGEIGPAVMELIKTFAAQGHSGGSADIAVGLFNKVARYEILQPLTGEDDEWMEVDDNLFQNKRASHVFKKDGQAYDINGKIFREPNGATYTAGAASCVDVTFPYTPKSEYIDVEKTTEEEDG